MVLSETIAYVTLLGLTIVFTAFALVICDKLWTVVLKLTAGIFWLVMAISQFYFFGGSAFLMILALPYAIFGLILFFAILNDYLGDKKDRIWNFND